MHYANIKLFINLLYKFIYLEEKDCQDTHILNT